MSTLLDRHIESSSEIRGGRPRIVGTRITVDDDVIMHRHLGQSLEEIAGKYELSPAGLYAAMAYYYEHQSAVDQQITDDDALIDAAKNQAPPRTAGKSRNPACG